MKITKHGSKTKADSVDEEFKCNQCGCEFTADDDEYYIEKGSQFTSSVTSSPTYIYHATVSDNYVCSCPECHKIVIKSKQRTVESQTTISSDTFQASTVTSVPDPCKTCSNHPSNGGSGICNCTLGMPAVTC